MTDSQVFMNLPRPPKLTLEALLKSSLGLQKQCSNVSEHQKTPSYTLLLGKKFERKWISEDTSGDLHNKIKTKR
jgi:hypothetical protein